MCALKCGAVLISFLIQITPALSPPHHTSSSHLGDYNCSRFGRHPRGASGAPQNCSHSFSTLCFFPPFFWHVFGCFTLWTEVIFVISISWSMLAPKLLLFAFLLNANFKFQICFCICRLSETDHANDQRQIGLRLPLYCFICADRYWEPCLSTRITVLSISFYSTVVVLNPDEGIILGTLSIWHLKQVHIFNLMFEACNDYFVKSF